MQTIPLVKNVNVESITKKYKILSMSRKKQNYNDFGFFFRIIISNKSKLLQIDQTEIKSSKRLENIFSSW